jgi:pilus assembly protein Flp/PilA
MKKLIKKMSGFMKNEEGQGLVEYALLLVLIAILAIGAITLLGQKVNNVYNNAQQALN